MITAAEARRIISNNGAHSFPPPDEWPALQAAAKLKEEGHEVSARKVGMINKGRLQVVHGTECKKCRREKR